MRAVPLISLAGVLALLATAAWWLAGEDGGPSEGGGTSLPGPGVRPAPVAPPDVLAPGGWNDPPVGFVPLPSTLETIRKQLRIDRLSVQRRSLPRPDARPRLVGRVTRAGEPVAAVRVVTTLDPEVGSAAGRGLRGLVASYAGELGLDSEEQVAAADQLSEGDFADLVHWHLLRRSADTDRDGRFVLPLPAPGPLQLWVEQGGDDRGHWFPTQALVLEPGELLDVELRLPTGRLEGQLVHAATGQALAYPPDLQVHDPRRKPEPFEPDSHRVLILDEDGTLVREVHAGRDGRFVAGDLPDGRYQVGVDSWQDVVVGDGVQEPAELTVPVRPAARLRGLVHRPHGGRSFREEQVQLVPEQVPAWPRAMLQQDADRQRPRSELLLQVLPAVPRVQRTRIGSFRFDDLPPGRYRLAVGADLTAEEVLREGLAVDASLGGDHELTLVTRD